MNEQEQLNAEQEELYTNYSPVTVKLNETTGLLVISAIAFFLLFALLRAQERIQELQEELRQQAKG
jgi:HAMP domain-containing protein